MLGIEPLAAALATGLLVVAFLEVLPPLGRFLPGQLLVGLLVALAWLLGAFSPWLVVPAFTGALAGDLANFRRAWRDPREGFGGPRAWWVPGHDVDRLEAGLRHAPLRTYLLRRFRTRDRALLPLSAGVVGMPPERFLAASAAACLLWSLAWVGLGLAVGAGAQVLPPLATAGMLLGFLLLSTRPLDAAQPT